MFLLAGLGNPGVKFEGTRHNIGFVAIDELAGDLDVEINRKKFDSLTCLTNIGDEKVLLMKPETFMNDSGRALKKAADFYKIDPTDVMVVYDDFDIPVGRVRIRPFGGPGTHNGMRSIVESLGTDRFPRVRIGTASGDMKEKNVIDFVLNKFDNNEREAVTEAAKDAALAMKCFVENGIDKAMNTFNAGNRKGDE